MARRRGNIVAISADSISTRLRVGAKTRAFRSRTSPTPDSARQTRCSNCLGEILGGAQHQGDSRSSTGSMESSTRSPCGGVRRREDLYSSCSGHPDCDRRRPKQPAGESFGVADCGAPGAHLKAGPTVLCPNHRSSGELAEDAPSARTVGHREQCHRTGVLRRRRRLPTPREGDRLLFRPPPARPARAWNRRDSGVVMSTNGRLDLPL